MPNFNVLFNESQKVIVGLGVGEADAFAGTKTSDIANASGANALAALIRNVSVTGTSTVTVEACSDVSATATTAVPFYWSRTLTGTNVSSVALAVAATGFATAAGEDCLYQITVDPAEIAKTGYKFWRVKMVEVVNDPSTGYIVLIHTTLRYPQAQPPAAIA